MPKESLACESLSGQLLRQFAEHVEIVIPVKTESQRCEDKNLRPFYKGYSLLEIKIMQAMEVVPAERIRLCVASVPSEGLPLRENRISAMADRYGIRVVPDRYHSQRIGFFKTQFRLVPQELRPRFTVFYFATMPFLGPSLLGDALLQIEQSDSVILFSAGLIEGQVFDVNGLPRNFLGFSVKGGQFIRKYQAVKSGLVIVRYDFNFFRVLRSRPIFYNPPLGQAVDINTEDDWALAQAYINIFDNRQLLDLMLHKHTGRR